MPVLCGSATQNIGVDLLCNFIVDAMPSHLNVASKIAVEEGTDKEVEILPNSDDPFLGLVFKTIADPFAGRLTLIKVLTGKLGSDGNFYNPNKSAKERFTQLLKNHWQRAETGKIRRPRGYLWRWPN